MEISQRIDFVFWLGTCLMVSLVLAFVIIALTYQNRFFKMKKDESDLLLKTALEIERNQRQRLAADMHDSLLSDLNAVKIYLAIVKRDGIENCYDEIKDGVDQALESARQISYNLMPPLLESQGLILTLKAYFKKLSAKTNISFSVVDQNHLKIPLSTKYELFRILQECTTNMIKHGKPNKCEITFNSLNEDLAIHIKDNGLPFDFEHSIKLSTGSGLRNIASRLQLLDAVLQKQGTQIENHYVIFLKI